MISKVFVPYGDFLINMDTKKLKDIRDDLLSIRPLWGFFNRLEYLTSTQLNKFIKECIRPLWGFFNITSFKNMVYAQPDDTYSSPMGIF